MKNQNQVQKDGSKKAARGQSGKPESETSRKAGARVQDPLFLAEAGSELAGRQIVFLLGLGDGQADRLRAEAALRKLTVAQFLEAAVRSALETPQRLDGLWETMEEVNLYVTECRTLLHIYGERYFEAMEYPGDKMVANGLASMGGCAGDSLGNAVEIAWQHVLSLGERAKTTKARAEMAAEKGGAS